MFKLITVLTLLTLSAFAGTWLIEGTPTGIPAGTTEETLRLDQTVQQTISNGAVRVEGVYVYEEAFAPSINDSSYYTPAIEAAGAIINGSYLNTSGIGFGNNSYTIYVDNFIYDGTRNCFCDYRMQGYTYLDGSSESAFSIVVQNDGYNTISSGYYDIQNAQFLQGQTGGILVTVLDNTSGIYYSKYFSDTETVIEITDPLWAGWGVGVNTSPNDAVYVGGYPPAYGIRSICYSEPPGGCDTYNGSEQYYIYSKRIVRGQAFYSAEQYYAPTSPSSYSSYFTLRFTRTIGWYQDPTVYSYIVYDYTAGLWTEVLADGTDNYMQVVFGDSNWQNWTQYWLYQYNANPATPLIIAPDIFVASNAVASVTVNGKGQIVSLVEDPNADAPMIISSGVRVGYLNADYLDGQHSSAFQPAGNYVTPNGATFTGGLFYTSSIYPGNYWTGRSVSSSWTGITYGNGLFVAVGASGNERAMTSPDGITWTARSACGNNDNWRSVTYGNGLFVAVSDYNDKVMTSPDGITWTARSACGNDDGWMGITFANGLFVAVGTLNDKVMTSPDGINWTARSSSYSCYGVAYGNGLFVAVNANATRRAITSPDGITWTGRSVGGDNDIWKAVTYGNGLFVIVGDSTDCVATSPDGINWTVRSACGNNDGWKAVTYGNGLFVAVGWGYANTPDKAMISFDGINWVARSVCGDNDGWTGVTYANGLFVAVSSYGDNGVMTSSIVGTEVVNHQSMTNYFATVKNIRWQDTVVSGMALRNGNPSPERTEVIPGSGIHGTGFDLNQDSDYVAQVQHGVASTSASFPDFYYNPHIHCSVSSVTAPETNATFVLNWQIAPVYSNFLGTSVSRTSTVSWAVSETNQHKLVSFGFITNNLLQGADSLIFRGNIKRIATPTLANDVPDKVIVDSLDYHFPFDSIGSTAIFGDAP